MAKFKLGDEVRIVKEYPGFEEGCLPTVGEVGVVKELFENGYIKVFLDNSDDFWFYKEESLKLVDNDTSPKYTYADVIIDPNDPRVEIGNEYYFGNNPSCLLKSISQLSASEGTLVMKDSAIEAQSSPFMSSEGEWFACLIRKKEPTYEEKQAEWVKTNDIKVGDKVRIIKELPIEERSRDDMKPLLGTIGEIKEITDEEIQVYTENKADWWYFTYDCLEKVEELELKVGDFVKDKNGRIGIICKIKSIEAYIRFNDLLYDVLYDVSYLDELTKIRGHMEPFDLSKEKDRTKLRGAWVRIKGSKLEQQIVGLDINPQLVFLPDVVSLETKELLEGYEFLDGTPCGIVVEDK